MVWKKKKFIDIKEGDLVDKKKEQGIGVRSVTAKIKVHETIFLRWHLYIITRNDVFSLLSYRV